MTVYKFSEEYTLANIDESSQLYTWIKYADDNLGNGMSDTPEGKKFMGIAYNKLTQQESDNPSDYEWIDIKGEDGIPGPPGTSTYTWIKYSLYSNGDQMQDDPNGMLYMGIAYNKNTAVESTNPQDYEWMRFRGENGLDGKPGTPGEDGISPIVATIESSQGNFFKQGIGVTTLSVIVFQGAHDVSEQCTFNWIKVDEESGIPDPTWSRIGNNITINQDDVNAKSTFFVTVNYTNLTAKANYTISDLFDMSPSIVPPANPQEGQVWLDISKEPPVLMVYSNGKWQPSAKDWSNEIKEITENVTTINQNITTIKSDITNLNNEIKLKVSQTTFDEQTKIFNTNIEGLKENIDNLQFSGTNLANLYGDKRNTYPNDTIGADAKLTGEFEFTLGKTANYSGVLIEAKDIIKEDGETYILSYMVQKKTGVLNNIGGHLDLFYEIFSNIEFYIDGVKQTQNYTTPAPVKDDNLPHYVVLSFKKKPYVGEINQLRLGMEINRGQTHNQEYRIWDIKLERSSKVTSWTPSSNDMLFLGKTPDIVNYFRNSAFNDLEDKKKFWIENGSLDIFAVYYSDTLKCNYMRMKKVGGNEGRTGIYQVLDLDSTELANLTGKTMTLSFLALKVGLAESTIPAEIFIRVKFKDGRYKDLGSILMSSISSSTWQEYSSSFTLDENRPIETMWLYTAAPLHYEIYFTKPCLRLGSKVLGWTPSPKDAEKATNDAKAQAIVYTDTKITDAKAEIQVKIDQISLGVEQNKQSVQQVVRDLNDLTLDTYNMIDYSSFRPQTQLLAKKYWLNYKGVFVGFSSIASAHIHPSQNAILGEHYLHTKGEPDASFVWYTPTFKVNVGTKYTASAFILGTLPSGSISFIIKTGDDKDFNNPLSYTSRLSAIDNKFHQMSLSATIDKPYARLEIHGSAGQQIAICHPMFSQSTKYVPWQVSPVEMGDRVEDNVKQIAQIKIDVGSITQTVSKHEQNFTQVNGELQGVTERLSQAEVKLTPESIVQRVFDKANSQNMIVNSSGAANHMYPWRSTLPDGYWTGFMSEVSTGSVSGWALRLSNTTGNEQFAFSNRFVAIPGGDITVSGYVFFEDSVINGADVHLLSSTDEAVAAKASSEQIEDTSYTHVNTIVLGGAPGRWHRFEQTFNIPGRSAYIRLDHNGVSAPGTLNCRIWFRDLMVNRGTMAMPWVDGFVTAGEAEVKITPTAIVNKVSAGIKNGTDMKGTSTTLTKDYFEVSHQGTSGRVRVQNGRIYCYADNGNASLLVGPESIGVCDFTSTTRKMVGDIVPTGSASGEKGFGLFTSQDASKLILGFAEYGNPTSALSQFEIRRNSGILSYAKFIDFFSNDVRLTSINQYDPSNHTVKLNNISINNNSISTAVLDSWLRLNLWYGNKVVVNAGSGNSNQYGSIRAREFETINAVRRMSPVQSFAVRLSAPTPAATKETISDIGSGVIRDNGQAIIFFDAQFLDFANTESHYFVSYETIGGNKDVKTVEHNKDYFVVSGEPGTKFSFRVECAAKGSNSSRFSGWESNKDVIDERGLNTINIHKEKDNGSVDMLTYLQEEKEKQSANTHDMIREISKYKGVN